VSRGHGIRQREILRKLREVDAEPWERWVHVYDLCGGEYASPAQREAYRRAVHLLARAGLVEVRRRPRAVRRLSERWTTYRPSLQVRLTLAPADAEAERQHRAVQAPSTDKLSPS
jgi:hypothetical protein